MSEVSAFQVYKSNKAQKPKNRNPKRDNKFKKKKKDMHFKTCLTTAIKNDVINENCKFVKGFEDTSKKKFKIGKPKKKASPMNGDTQSDTDEEPPLLVPIPCATQSLSADMETAISSSSEDDGIKKRKKKKRKVDNEKKPLVLNPDRVSPDVLDDDEEHADVEELPINEDSFAIGEDMLKYLMAPTNINKFFQEHWEKKPLYISRDCNTYYSSLITSEKLDSILRIHTLHYTKNIDIVTYENGKRETLNPAGCAVAPAVWDFYGNGCSVRLLNPQTYCSKLYVLISTLQEYFGNMVGTNLYLTPPGSQGFAPHYDDIEAFVIQIEGRKHWKLYSPKNGTKMLPRYSSNNLERKELGDPVMEVTLHAGDFLYFPRGFVHEAFTDNEAHSLHITLSVYQKTAFVDLFERMLPNALHKAANCDKTFRKGLPMHYLRHLGAVNKNQRSQLRRQILKQIDSLFDKLKEYISADDAADELGRQFMYDAMPPFLMDTEKFRTSKEGGERLSNGEVINRVEFDLDTEVRLLRYHCLRLLKKDNRAFIYYCTENGLAYHEHDEQMLEIDLAHSSIVEALQNAYPNYMRICDLPINDYIAKIQIVGELWEYKLIVTKEPLNVID